MRYNFSVFDSRFGSIGLVFSGAGRIARIYLPRKNEKTIMIIRTDFPGASEAPLPVKVRNALENCMKGLGCDGLLNMLDMDHLKPFQKAVLLREAEVPRGKVISYARLAAKAGFSRAARAAGSALAKNPFPLAIPCHRAVRSDGSLGGFGGGLEMKRALLEMEGVEFDKTGKVKKEYFID